MTLEELEKKHDELAVMCYDLQVEINALKKAQAEDAKTIPPHPRWKPRSGDAYFTTQCAGFAAECHWMCDSLDEEFYSLGFVFKTKAEAEFDAERLRVLAEMREWAGNYNDAVMLTCDTHRNKVFYVPAGDTWVHGEMRFATEEDAEAGAMRRVAKIKRAVQECLDQIPDTPKAEKIRSNIESMADRVVMERRKGGKNERKQY